MDSVSTYWADRALLEWQVELGVTEAMLDTPVDRYALAAVEAPKVVVKPVAEGPPAVRVVAQVDPVSAARDAAAAAGSLEALQSAIDDFTHCPLRRGARKTVFAAGAPSARVMVIGDVPDRDEDRTGVPFAGPQGQLLDKMLSAIGLERGSVYLTAALPWRTPGDAQPRPEDIAMLRPFVERHIALANPDVLVLMGAMATEVLMGNGHITRLRGNWSEVMGRPALPMLHPATLLKTPLAKRDAWADLLSLKAWLRDGKATS